MLINLDNPPCKNELPSEYADRLGLCYAKTASITHKKSNGQFFTPLPIARLMSSFCTIDDNSVRILDPGCGTAILTCALVEHLIEKYPNLELVDLVAYETDAELISTSQHSLKYLKEWLSQKGVEFQYVLLVHDFILDNASIKRRESNSDYFNLIISNPPYFKLSKDDKRAFLAKEFVSGQPNIYSLFMGVASKMLAQNGQLVFITPRSFASGSYFKSFRESFFNEVQIDQIHLFKSRKDAFVRDKVLQETVVIKATKEALNPNKSVVVSSSAGLIDINEPTSKTYKSNELIDIATKEKILHLPVNDQEEEILNLVRSWENNLTDYNIQVSTGPVVSFRALNFIQDKQIDETQNLAPLIWLHNVNKMELNWPMAFKEKGQYIQIQKSSMPLLIPNKDYILLRRFSTKDDKSRLIATPFFCKDIEAEWLGIENKLNYIYRKGSHLEPCETIGLCALLNSDLFNTYFQIFNGNVNVSATELREMKMPSHNDIKEIGHQIMLANNYSMESVNQIVANIIYVQPILV